MHHALTLLRDRNPAARLRALRSLGPPDAEPSILQHLLGLLRDSAGEARVEALRALARLGPQAVPILLEALDHPDFGVRRDAALALGKVGVAAPEVVHGLARTLQDPDAVVRLGAAQGLGMLGPAAAGAVPALLEALADSNLILGRLAAQALSRIGVLAIPALTGALRSPDRHVRREAAWALGQIGPAAAESADALANLLGDIVAPEASSARRTEYEVTTAVAVDVARYDATCRVPIDPAGSWPDADSQLRATVALALQRVRPAAND